MRRILISGANRGIGKSVANRLLNDGHFVSLGIRDKESLNRSEFDIAPNQSQRLLINYYDSLEHSSAKSWIQNTAAKFGEIDTLIHCAGILNKTEFLFKDSEIKDIDEIWRVNVLGPWILTKEAWQYLVKSEKGRIIVLVSMSGKRVKSKLASYSMSKFALISLCQSMRNEGWEKGIRVTAICPGWVNTDMSKEVKDMAKSDMTQPGDIAKLCSNLLELSNSCVPFEIQLNCNLER